MRAREFINEASAGGVRGGGRGDLDSTAGFTGAHPSLIGPTGRSDVYIGRYYDFYRVSSLVGMDLDELDKTQDISFFGNLPVFSAYTDAEREKLTKVLKKLKMNPKDWIPSGSKERSDSHTQSPIKPFKGYDR